jgi:hypothetical protein
VSLTASDYGRVVIGGPSPPAGSHAGVHLSVLLR